VAILATECPLAWPSSSGLLTGFWATFTSPSQSHAQPAYRSPWLLPQEACNCTSRTQSLSAIGRTARVGKSGIAPSLVTQYDLELYQRIEAATGKKPEAYPTEKEEIMSFQGRVEEAQRHARVEMKAIAEARNNRGQGGGRGKERGKTRRDDMDKEDG